jgi:hypothetical protein
MGKNDVIKLINEKKYLKTFIGFLKRNNAYEAFVKNLTDGKVYRKRYGEVYDDVEYIVNKIRQNPHNLLVDAFNWDKRDDDIDWAMLSFEWDELMHKLGWKRYCKTL